MDEIKVTNVKRDTANYEKGKRVTLERADGKKFTVNIPDFAWGGKAIYGLNLVFDHSGKGDHYT